MCMSANNNTCLFRAMRPILVWKRVYQEGSKFRPVIFGSYFSYKYGVVAQSEIRFNNRVMFTIGRGLHSYQRKLESWDSGKLVPFAIPKGAYFIPGTQNGKQQCVSTHLQPLTLEQAKRLKLKPLILNQHKAIIRLDKLNWQDRIVENI